MYGMKHFSLLDSGEEVSQPVLCKENKDHQSFFPQEVFISDV